LMTVAVYDLNGRTVSLPVNQHLAAGSYRYFLDTLSFARGCYVTRLKAGTTGCMKTVRILN
jgi:hypothetical protein